MDSRALFAFAILAIFVVIACIVLLSRKRDTSLSIKDDTYTIEKLCELCKAELANLTKDDNFIGRTDEEWEALYHRKIRIQKANRNCTHGIESDKIIIKDLIRNIISSVLLTEEDVLNTLDFHNIYLDVMVKYEILLYRLKKKHSKDALKYLIEKYGWANERRDIEDGLYTNYAVTMEDIDNVYATEMYKALTYEEMLDMLSTLVYQKIRGFGCIDTTLEMNIDGVNCGASGSIVMDIIKPGKIKETAPRSVWVYYKGKYIHFRFLTFYTIEEIRRVTLAICRYNSPGPLTEKKGFVVNTMWDQSRVLALRPSASEYWAFFVRKFSLGDMKMDKLVDPTTSDGKHIYQNTQLIYNMIKYLMMCKVTCGYTGRQGTGKTTLMCRSIEFIDPKYTVRVLEMAPEMYLREMYPLRNILSVSETEYVSATQLQDALKKSDAAISIVGEVATDSVAARMLQMGQVASIFTIFSHHANTTSDLIESLTNSIIATSHGAATPATAMPQVIDVVKVDIHLDYDVEGNRFIDRITEVRGLGQKPYPERRASESLEDYEVRLRKEYYTRSTDRKMYECVDVIRFNRETFTYEVTDNFFSEKLTKYMLRCCPKQYVKEFVGFVQSNWKRGA